MNKKKKKKGNTQISCEYYFQAFNLTMGSIRHTSQLNGEGIFSELLKTGIPSQLGSIDSEQQLCHENGVSENFLEKITVGKPDKSLGMGGHVSIKKTKQVNSKVEGCTGKNRKEKSQRWRKKKRAYFKKSAKLLMGKRKSGLMSVEGIPINKIKNNQCFCFTQIQAR